MTTRSKELTEALSAMICQQPFFSVLLMQQMNIVETDTVPTAATNGVDLMVNPAFFNPLDIDERVFILAHEVMHAVFQHVPRMKAYQDRAFGPDLKPWSDGRWGHATDYVINALLTESGCGRMPQGGLFHPDFKGGDNVDDVYVKVKEPPKDKSGHGKQGQGTGKGFDQHLPPPPGTPPPSASEVKQALKSAANAAKAQGNMPDNLKRLVDELVEPQVNWQEKLKQNITAGLGNDSISWARPRRRALAMEPHMYLPGRVGFRSGNIGVVVDTSGSISDHEVKVFLGEVAGILEGAKPEQLLLAWCDSAVAGHDWIEEPNELLTVEKKGGGGTDMREGIDYLIDKLGAYQTTIVVLTDGYTPFHDQAPEVPVIWGMTTDVEAPYGENIRVEIPDA